MLSARTILNVIKMKLENIVKTLSTKPPLYEKGTAMMWTDPYISTQLLNVHLDPGVDLASRKTSSITATIQWILSQTNKKQLAVLDLGCGPGLYTHLYARQGHEVSGVDFSEVSIEYAREQAKKNDLEINYSCQNYLELEIEDNQFDLITLIYADFGVLIPNERERLLHIVHKALKPGGILVFDVLNDRDLEGKIVPKSWEATEHGFWKDQHYLVLSESFLYRKHKVILYQHTVLSDDGSHGIYRFWTTFFSHSDLSCTLEKHEFTNITFNEDVLPGNDPWNGENVTFCTAMKQEGSSYHKF